MPDADRFAAALARAREIAGNVIAPRATESDLADDPPVENIRALIDAGLIGLTTPIKYGGIGANGRVLRAYTEIMSAACGVTSFVQGQHQSAALIVAGGQNQALKEAVLPKMASGDTLCGVAFSHLRRPGAPMMNANPSGDGYLFNGTAPWVTGWGIMTDVVLGGTLPDGRLVWVVAPLEENDAMRPSPPMPLCAMNASGTVSLSCRDYYVGSERWIKTITREEMARNDVSAILGVLAQPFGVTCAAISLLESLRSMRKPASMDKVIGSLSTELAEIRADSERWQDRSSEPGFKENALRIRARAIRLGARAAHAAVTASAGGANNLNHPAQRLFREAMFYTLTAQTPDVMSATLGLLAEI